MKWLFGLVLLLNLIVAVWFGIFSGEDNKGPATSDPTAKNGSIVLLRERESPKPVEPPPTAALAMRFECSSLGPFKNAEEASGAVMQLKAQGWSSVARKSEERAPKGYWVFIPPAPNSVDAKKTLREMHSANVDSFLITKGPNTNAISVGIYSDLKYAEERRDELRAKGFDVRLEERVSSKTQFWVDMTSDGSVQLTDEMRRKLLIDFRGADIRQGECGDTNAAAP